MNLKYVGDNGEFSKFIYKDGCENFNYIAKLFDGIYLILTDYKNLYDYEVAETFTKDAMNISYCIEGHMKWYVPNTKEMAFFTKKSFMVSCISEHCDEATFPSGSLKAIEFFIDVNRISEKVYEFFLEFGIDVYEIYKKFKVQNTFVLRGEKEVEDIFKKMKEEDLFRLEKYRLIFLETLFYLNEVKLSADQQFIYLPKSHIDKIKKVKELITEDYRKKYTLKELEDRTNMSTTYLNKVFKEVYGESIHSYLIGKKMEYAKEQMARKNITITEIAQSVGYVNASKFSDVFKKYEGVSPRIYRGGLDYDL